MRYPFTFTFTVNKIKQVQTSMVGYSETQPKLYNNLFLCLFYIYNIMVINVHCVCKIQFAVVVFKARENVLSLVSIHKSYYFVQLG